MNMKNSLKILCITQRFFPAVGGAEKVVENYMDFLSKNHSVTVFTTNAYDLKSFWDSRGKTVMRTEGKNYAIKRFPILIPEKVNPTFYNIPFTISSPGPFSPELWNSLLNTSEKFDLVIATAFPYDHIIPALLASKKYNIPLITIPHLHLEFPHLYFTSSKLTILANSNSIVVNTDEEKKALLNYNIPVQKIHVIPPGIKIETSSEDSEDIRKKLGISENSLLILFVGRRSPEKGIITLIESLKLLWQRKKELDLIIIGASTQEFVTYIKNLNPKMKKHIFDLGVASNKEKNSAFRSCDIFVMPSIAESFGITYLEAWLHKKPVIGCNIVVIRNIIEDNKNGLLVKFGDTSRLAEAIEKLRDPKLRENFGTAGHEKLIKKYDSEKLCKEFEEMCLSVLSSRSVSD